jgi:aminoglycoside phosphotransferase (APT) family kinase protein
MKYQPIEREPGAFQQPVTAEQLVAMCERAFGPGVDPVSAVEIGDGAYNNTYRVEFGSREPVILRVAPRPDRQFRIERELMRNEHAALPFFAPIAAMMPRTLFADWTRDIAGRDYVVQTMLPGECVSAGALARYPKPQWPTHYRQLGRLARQVHAVRGERFGPIAGPTFATWSEAVLSLLANTVADVEDASLDASDLRQVAGHAQRRRDVLDQIGSPRLLHGDLWSNLMLDTTAPTPTITGLIDYDRASWGDPLADWTIFMATRRSSPERDAFWETYGPLDPSPDPTWRLLIYRAAHLGAVRLERHRGGNTDTIPETYDNVRAVLDQLA